MRYTQPLPHAAHWSASMNTKKVRGKTTKFGVEVTPEEEKVSGK